MTCLSMFGESYATNITLEAKDEKKLESLNKVYSRWQNKTTYVLWLRYFETGKGQNGEFELEAMLAY